MRDITENISEALTQLTNKPLFASDVERIMITYELRDLYADEPQPIRFGHLLYEMLNRVSVPLEPYDIIAGRVVSRELTDEEEKVYRNFTWAPENPRLTTMLGTGHATLSWDYILEYGLPGMKRQALDFAEEQTDVEKRTFLRGAALIYDAISNYLQRYSRKATELGMDDLALTCAKAAWEKPDSFRTALQLLWVITLIDCSYLEVNPTLTLGRLDQLLYPFYKKDIESGWITRAEAKEIITDYFCKQNLNMGRGEHQVGDESNTTNFFRNFTFDAPQYLLLGGTDELGLSACNELTTLFIECIVPGFKNPVSVFRYHKALNEQHPNLWRLLTQKAMASASLIFYNDDNVINAFKEIGLPDIDARKYTHFGCNWASPGENSDWMRPGPLSTRFRPEMSEAEKKAVATPNIWFDNNPLGWPMDFMDIIRQPGMLSNANLTIDDVYDAFFNLYDSSLRNKLACLSRELEARQLSPSRILTYGDCFYRHSIRNAECFAACAKYHFEIQPMMGFGSVIDCFTVVDKLVFQDKTVTLARLVEAADANFEGYEKELALCRAVEKYGSNSQLSNSHARRFSERFARLVHKRNKPYFEKQRLFVEPCINSDTHHLKLGEKAGATVDGRLAGQAYAQNSCPAHGSCIRGLTGMLNSILSLPLELYPCGTLNLDIQKSQFEGENGEQLFGTMLAAYFNNGGLQAQVSCVDVDDLLAAQKEPNLYRDLRVRVTGYSGIFVDICKRLQDDIIERMKIEKS